ncbi:mannose-1-phosphate guanylyltransferase [Clostridium sp.]|uniref:mannose-1-phosphate guanylyltransferase n=1 Tax=Clostridium sp. TaxID=1506 RepID=UPI002605B63D|nr:mannose-1-phosphate guanylyltransferase [Clostridium sp.]
MICALIMAGGKGTRFWPLSTEEKPKQFLNLIGEETMIQMTVNRIKPIIPIDRIFICTGKMYINLIKEQLPDLPERNIIIEPEGRNTAPCIALSAFIIRKYYNNSTMLVLPSDHLIKNENEFRSIVSDANTFIKENSNAIITLGMKPSRPETGYGYIKFSVNNQKVNQRTIIKVDSFVEKPDKHKAEEYIKEGSYLWNGGMFLWKIDNILGKIKKYSISTYKALASIENVEDDKLQDLINENYKNTESISIDYAVLEKSSDIYVIPSDFGWDDVGSWEAIERYRKCDKNKNIHIGDITALNSKNNLIVSSNNKIIIDGLDDIYVIENDGKIVVGKKDRISTIKSLKDII